MASNLLVTTACSAILLGYLGLVGVTFGSHAGGPAAAPDSRAAAVPFPRVKTPGEAIGTPVEDGLGNRLGTLASFLVKDDGTPSIVTIEVADVAGGAARLMAADATLLVDLPDRRLVIDGVTQRDIEVTTLGP